jgi:alpha-D-ribose 1-methylphosphonate 5-triphosphate diphosphatase
MDFFQAQYGGIFMSGRHRYALVGGHTLLPQGLEAEAVVLVEDGVIAAVGSETGGARVVNAHGLHVLPGIVDLHGDAFERQLMPRPGVHFDMQLALSETDRQLVANGITTAYHGVTYSWEPGLRGRDAMRQMLAAMECAKPYLACDTKLHLRQETYNLDGEQEVLSWLSEGKIDLLAFNNHLPDILRKLAQDHDVMNIMQRTGLSAPDLHHLASRVAAREDEVQDSIRRLASAALSADVAQASHDDPSPDVRQWYQDLGCGISEFPKTKLTAALARELGNHVVFGSPNVVRGGSHQKNAVAAAQMVSEELCTVLTSDYYYPAMLPAAFRLANEGLCSFAQAWAMISCNPADAAKLKDRGRLQTGLRADITLVKAPAGRAAHAVTSLIGGRVAYAGFESPVHTH